MDEPAPHFLYVIAARGSDEGPVKLGLSADPDARLRTLQTASPQPLEIRHREPVDARIVKDLERLLHRDMGHRRRRGEWFAMRVDEAVAQVRFTVIRYENTLLEAAEWRS